MEEIGERLKTLIFEATNFTTEIFNSHVRGGEKQHVILTSLFPNNNKEWIEENGNYMIWGLVLLCIYVSYRYLLSPNRAKEVNCTKFNNQSTKFEALRRKKFPKPYPNGWYNLGMSSTLKKGQIKSISALGIDIIVFRGMDNQLGVLDAYCPHIGAHLGVAGKVVQNTVECSFHGWRFNTEGECVHIPYSDKPIPCFARTRAWHFREKFGLIWLWFDAENSPPRYELQDVPEIEANLSGSGSGSSNYYYGGVLQLEFNQHISEMFENSADYHHFNTLHAPFPLPIVEKFLSVHHKAELSFPYKHDDTKKHMCCFTQKITHLNLFNFISIPFILPQITKVTFEGPSIMHFRMYTPMGKFHVIKTVLPVKPFKLYSEDHWWADWKVPRICGKITAMIISRALEQDRLVWENKSFNRQPVLVEGDGPWKPFRSWYSQHYSASSLDVSSSYLEW